MWLFYSDLNLVEEPGTNAKKIRIKDDFEWFGVTIGSEWFQQ